MTHFIRSGNVYRAFPGNALDISETLPVGNYALKFSMMEGFYLEQQESFTRKGKIYGDCLKNCDRILNTFNKREGNTGVLLVGEKGSGKTLLARQISIESNMPTIIINSEYTGDNFNSFISSITQPCVILLDEFEKVYKKEAQQALLTLLDGTYQSKKLFVLTSNDKYRLDEHMKNRPGRLFYFLEFSGLEESFIVEYCKDNLDNLDFLDDVLSVSSRFSSFNFDLLSSIVEESNRYGESPKTLVSILNAKPEFGGSVTYTPLVKINNVDIPQSALNTRDGLSLNTFNEDFHINIYFQWRRNEETDQHFIDLLNPDPDEGYDWDAILSEVERGNLVFKGKSREPFGKDVPVACDYTQTECTPSDIYQYGSGGSTVYNPDEGMFVTLVKKSEKKSGGGSKRNMNDIFASIRR